MSTSTPEKPSRGWKIPQPPPGTDPQLAAWMRQVADALNTLAREKLSP